VFIYVDEETLNSAGETASGGPQGAMEEFKRVQFESN
jgi:hypothetical protein